MASMPLSMLIERLTTAGVVVRPEGTQLRYEAPAGALTAELLHAMRTHKADLLALFQDAQAQPSQPARSIPRAPRQRTMPVCVAQRRLWFLYHLERRGATYNMPKAARLRGALDLEALELAFAAVIARHEALRTSFETLDGEPVQVVHPQVSLRLQRHEPEREEGATELAVRLATATAELTHAAQQAFDLSQAPLLRVHVWRLAPQDHLLLVVVHHIIADGRSLEVLFEELAAFYGAAVAGAPAPHLTELAIQYADYAVFERDWLAQPHIRAQLDWWRKRLEGAPVALRLPTDRPRPAVQTFTGSVALFTVPLPQALQLRTLAQAQGASLYMALVAAMAALLAAFSGEEEICIGCPVENRALPETAALIGVFINTVVLRIRVQRHRSFRDLLEQVRAVALDAYQHQDVPFEQVVEALQPERSTATSPWFQVALSALDGRRAFPRFAGIELEPLQFDFGRVKFDLNLELYDTGAELRIAWFFNTTLFDADTTQRWGAHLLGLLAQVVELPAVPIMALDWLPLEDRAALQAWNQTAASYPRARSVVELIAEQVQRTPAAVAVVCGEHSLTYRELARRGDMVAAWLATAGVPRGAIVALAMQRSVEVVVAILGVLQAGAAYLPLDMAAPTERLAFMLREAAPAVVLVASQHTAPSLPEVARIAAIDEIIAATTALETSSSKPAPCCSAEPHDLAYVLYTSGSTGTPKAVLMEHRGLLNYAVWAARSYTRGRATSFALFTSLAFDLTVTSLFVPLLTGGRIVVYPERNTPAVFDVFRDAAVDVVKLTPAHLALIADTDLRVTTIHTLIVGGEDLKRDLAQRVLDASGGTVVIYNEYGPTEAAVGCMIHRFDPLADTAVSVPIGVAADNVRIHLLDRAGSLAPLGGIGELYIAGDGVARGYLHRPELTAARFLPEPAVSAARMYRTGDLARRRADGCIEYLGRADRQVKLRGHRIELDEVAAALAAHPAVADCSVELVTRTHRETAATTHCLRCGLASSYPGTTFDGEGVCDVCRDFDRYRHRVERYFRTPEDFVALLESARTRGGDYDCLALLSGGKDSVYMLARMQALGARVLAYTFDPGYLSEQAKHNIRLVTAHLGIDHEFATTAHMGEIFADSLRRHANVCNGCFKTLYTLSLAAARARGIPLVITGLSRGQLFETRLSKYYNNPAFDPDTLDAAVVQARQIYHRLDDVIARRLDVAVFQDPRLFEQVQVVDFYRYFEVSLSEMLAYLDALGWRRPADTGRSTNCLINDVGIFVHRRQRGYHNYALPYSWDVRLGHKTRAQALTELDDAIDEARVTTILHTLGVTPPAAGQARAEECLVAYYVARAPVSEAALRDHLLARLPAAMVPTAFVALPALPLTANGKINRRALPPLPCASQPASGTPPRTELEREIAAAWARSLGFEGFGIEDDFFAIGGHSLMATQVASRLTESLGVELPLAVLFDKPTIAALAAAIEPAWSQAQARGATLDALLMEINTLTDEQAKEQLDGESSSS